MSGPLTGISILDLTTVVMGPFATQILGDLGADVIKVEPPGGDSNRFLSPGRNAGMSGIAMTMHRNKRSIVLDLKNTAARSVLMDLAARTDVLIHNMLPDVVSALGLEYQRLGERNPALIYCAAAGFGNGGPYSGQPAYDDLIQGASGIAALMTGDDREPRYFPGVICDKVTGLTVVNAVLAAFIHRQKTGEGQQITVPMFETMVAFNLVEHSGDHIFSPPAGDFGYRRVLSKHRKPYRTADGYICVLAYSDRQWRDFFKLVERPELADDDRFSDLARRSRNIDELYEIVSSSLAGRTTGDWIDRFRSANVPATRVLDLAGIGNDTHVMETGFIKRRVHATQGAYDSIGVPIEFSVSKPDDPEDAPTIGQHTEEILSELGYSEKEIREFCEA